VKEPTVTAVAQIAERPTASGLYPRRWPAAVVMMLAVTMDLIDVTIVNVALPTIRRDFAGTAAMYPLAAATGRPAAEPCPPCGASEPCPAERG